MSVGVSELIAPFVVDPVPEELTGACWNETFDVLFARGFPLMRFAVDDHLAHKQLEATLAKLDKAKSYESLGLIWPTQVARYLVSSRLNLAPDFGVQALEQATTSLVRGGAPNAFQGHEELVLLLEALFGSAPVFDAVINALDVSDDDLKKLNVWAWGVVVALHAISLRVPVAQREAGLARLQSLHQRAPTPFVKWITDALLNGTEGASRSGHKVGADVNPLMAVLMARGAPKVTELSKKLSKDGLYHARLAYLGDPAVVVPELAAKFKAIKGQAARELYAVSVGAIAHPRALDVVLDAWDGAKSRPNLKGWLELYGERFREALGESKDPRVSALLAAL
ncbi:MAG: hypothetical protein R3B07_18945 [Polyangiaceae bacterium]